MKIGIVTAYDEHEANSEYSKALKEEFERQGHSVEILRLPFNVFTNLSFSMQKLADHLIDDMVEKIKKLDYVNIQYETGLFGTNIQDVFRRIKKILSVCKEDAFSITIHSQIHFESKKIKQNKIKIFFNDLTKKHKTFTQKNINRLMYRVLLSVIQKNGLIITHTMRAKKTVLSEFPSANVQAFPLCYKRLNEIKDICFDKEKYKKEKGINIASNAKVIGVLGAFTPWKDLKTVVKALSLLPDEFHVFFFGGMHKLDFKYHIEGLGWIYELQEQIISLNLQNRVHFMGYQPTSEDMLNAQLFCDYAVFPYKEVGEDGPGAPSSALEVCDNVFLTRNDTFEELKEFTGEAFFSFDMGNYMELAEKIKSLPSKQIVLQNRKDYFEKYNIQKNAEMYLSVLKGKM